MDWKGVVKNKGVQYGALGVGALAVLYFAFRSSPGDAEAEESQDSDYTMGYYAPGGAFPVDFGGIGGTSTNQDSQTALTSQLLSLAEKSTQLQANQTYAGISSQFFQGLTDSLKTTVKTGATGSFNFGGTPVGFDFSFKAPTTPVASPSANNTTNQLLTKLVTTLTDQARSSGGGNRPGNR